MIEIEFLSAAVLSQKEGKQKIDFLVASLKKGKILVLEEPLTHSEETKLIEATMKSVSEKFPGIEIGTLGRNDKNHLREQIIRMLGGKPSGFTVIGPSKLVRQMKRDPETLSLFAGDGQKR